MPSTIGIVASHINYTPPTFSIVPDKTEINEGREVVTYTIIATNFTQDTIYWTNAGTADAADFGGLGDNGTITLVGGQATLTLVAREDFDFSEGEETFIVEIRTDSISGPVKSTAIPVTIRVPSFGIVPSVTSATWDDTITWTITADNIKESANIYNTWSLEGLFTHTNTTEIVTLSPITFLENATKRGSFSRQIVKAPTTENLNTNLVVTAKYNTSTGVTVAISPAVQIITPQFGIGSVTSLSRGSSPGTSTINVTNGLIRDGRWHRFTLSSPSTTLGRCELYVDGVFIAGRGATAYARINSSTAVVFSVTRGGGGSAAQGITATVTTSSQI